MDSEPKFKLGNSVWFISGNHIYNGRITVIRKVQFFGTDIETSYEYGAAAIYYLEERKLFKTKEELLKNCVVLTN